MDYKFINNSIDIDNIILPESDKINSCIRKNSETEITKAIKFLASGNKFLQLHGFIGTGKRQVINYLGEFIDKDVIKLEYYCKVSTVCDDILISFLSELEEKSQSKSNPLNSKITTLNVKFQQHIVSVRKPVLIILHTADDITEENIKLVNSLLKKISEEKNIKIIISTRAILSHIFDGIDDVQKVFLKAFTTEVFNEFIVQNKLSCSDKQLEDFYDCTHGYYYYTALSIKITLAMKLTICDFLAKYRESGMKFEEFLCTMYLNLLPPVIRNFFWFLKTIRHGITLNALAILDIYDDFSIEFLKSNLMVFQDNETLYVQDLFYQKTDISIPDKIQIRLHKYIIGIYEKQLKLNLSERIINISRQALRAEIEYHNHCIDLILHKDTDETNVESDNRQQSEVPEIVSQNGITTDNIIEQAKQLIKDKNLTRAIEILRDAVTKEDITTQNLVEIRLLLANLYKETADYKMSGYYYDLVETYYKHSNENINLNYLYYDLADLYCKMYKKERATEILKKVIYSVDTPASLLVDACIRLGNIYSDSDNSEDAYVYYQKALDSLNENVEQQSLCELYFKYALANDDRGDMNQAFEYYNKCIAVGGDNVYKASAYSNLASCYYEKDSYSDAIQCFISAYNIEKNNNNYEGVYYNASHIAKIYFEENSDEALNYLKEAKQSAEFINDELYIIHSSIALGDYYYNKSDKYKEALMEYLKSYSIAKRIPDAFDITNIERRINDMKLRMDEKEFAEIEKKYEK